MIMLAMFVMGPDHRVVCMGEIMFEFKLKHFKTGKIFKSKWHIISSAEVVQQKIRWSKMQDPKSWKVNKR